MVDDVVGSSANAFYYNFECKKTLMLTRSCLSSPHIHFSNFLVFEDFHGIENWLLLRALKTLESSGKAEIISLGEGSDGVKFF